MRNKLHFTKIDWIIYFPLTGNQDRKIPDYGVAYRDRINKRSQSGKKIYLSDVLIKPVIKTNYPHNVALYQKSVGRGSNWKPKYIDERTIQNEKDLIAWIRKIEEKK